LLQHLLHQLPREDAQDVAQEVFLRFLRIERPETIRDPETYLKTVARHVLMEFHRRSCDQGKVTYDSALLERCTEDMGDAGMRPVEDEIDFNRSINDIEAACSELPYHHRRALVLKLRDDLSKEEIAEHLGLTVKTVRTYLNKALAHCRRAFGKDGGRR
jgi:RNA polymerase sigma-70 factor (ECF subfamily)